MDGRDALRTAVVCLGGLLLLAGCPSPPVSSEPPVSTSSPASPTTGADASSAGIRTLTIPTAQLPSRTTSAVTGFACGIPGVSCTPTQTPTTTEEIDDPSPTP